MLAGGEAGGASFSEMASTMAEDVVLHQTPDLPWGGEFRGVQRYAQWAGMMSNCFESVDVQDASFLEDGYSRVVVLCTLVTTARLTGEVMKSPMVQVITVSKGKITEFRPFYWHVPDYVAAYRGELTSSSSNAAGAE